MCKDGGYRWMLSRGLALRGQKGHSYRMAGSQTDVTEGKRIAEQLLQEAFYDGLTKLPNRALFMDRLYHAVKRGERTGSRFSVLFIDLDRFKFINDSLGHLAGRLISSTETADRINHLIRPADTFARLGGDEFVILLEDIDELSNATGVAERVRDVFRRPFSLKGREVFVTASIGIALSSGEIEETPGSVARRRILPCTGQRKVTWRTGSSSIHPCTKARSRFSTCRTIYAAALDNDEFFMVYQPIVDVQSNRVASLEALMRWVHPSRGVVSPDSFIPLAEETGLIIPMGEWVLNTVCRQIRDWRDEGITVPVAVNLSARQLRDSGLPDIVSRCMKKWEINPDWLEWKSRKARS